jgi:flap endonuclease-1
LTQSAFLDFCILLGTDASPRIPGIGPSRAYKLIHIYGSIEEILAKEPKHKDKIESIEGFMEMVQNAREVFGRLPPIPEGLSLEQGEYDARKVEAWLRDEHGVMFVYSDQVEEDVTGDDPLWEVSDLDADGVEAVADQVWDEQWDEAVLDEQYAPPRNSGQPAR